MEVHLAAVVCSPDALFANRVQDVRYLPENERNKTTPLKIVLLAEQRELSQALAVEPSHC
jgi:hypothetical protein